MTRGTRAAVVTAVSVHLRALAPGVDVAAFDECVDGGKSADGIRSFPGLTAPSSGC